MARFALMGAFDWQAEALNEGFWGSLRQQPPKLRLRKSSFEAAGLKAAGGESIHSMLIGEVSDTGIMITIMEVNTCAAHQFSASSWGS